jgi:oligoribonuclease
MRQFEPKIMAHDPFSPAVDTLAAAPAPAPVLDDNHLVWVDMEMSGLLPDSDRILEVAMVVTDAQLNTVAEGPVLVVHQDDAVLGAMDAWNQGTHGRSGLTGRVRASPLDEAAAEQAMLEFLARHVRPGKSPMCGNSICQDRRFMARWMPRLEAFFHYRNLDVSTLKELAKRWNPSVARSFEKKSRHEALADVYESIEELRHYRVHWIEASAGSAAAAPVPSPASALVSPPGVEPGSHA